MPRRQAERCLSRTGVTSGKRSRRSLGECTTRAQICLDLGQRRSVLAVQQARGARFGQSGALATVSRCLPAASVAGHQSGVWRRHPVCSVEVGNIAPGLLSSFAAVSVAWTRRVQLEGAANFRDLGGYPTTQGPVVATGRVFRSDSLHLCSEQDLAVLDALGIRAVYDLRRQEEIEDAPGPRRHVHLEVVSRRLRDTDPVALQERADGERWLFEDYRSMLERSGGVFGTLFGRLVEPEGAPCVFHCLGGKDRTVLPPRSC